MPFAFACAILALVATAGLGAAALRLASPVSFLLAAYVLASAEIVVVSEILSPPRLVTAWGYILAEAVLLGAAVYVWNRHGRARPPLRRIEAGAIRRHPILAVLGVIVGIAVCYQAFLAVGTPPNNDDSMSQHLSRAAAWLQHRGVYWIGHPHTQRENEWLPNGELQVLYTFAFLHRDTVAALVQFVAEGALLVSVAGSARRLGWSRGAAIYAALLTATLPQVALQSVTTQNDLLVAAFVGTAAYFVRSTDPRELALAGLAAGLAVGTKATALLAVPTLLLIAAVSARPRPRLPAAVLAAAGFAAVGGFGYIHNLAETGHPLGTGIPARGYRTDVTARGTVSNLAKMTWRQVDFPGYHLPKGVRSPLAQAAEDSFDALRIPVNPPEATGFPYVFDVNISSHESIAWFGPLGFLLLLPVVAVFLVGGLLRRSTAAAAATASALPIVAVLLADVYRDGPWYGRYLLAAVAICAPLFAAVYRFSRLSALVAAVGTLTLGLTHAFNAAKPTGLDGGPVVWGLSRARVQSLEIPGFDRVITAVDRTVPSDARLGTIMWEHDWDYPFYGERLERRIEGVPRREGLAGAERRGLRWVLVGRGLEPPPLRRGWSERRFSWYGTLLERRG
ncbi:MAG: glycosyltransferase 87 family protein [Thermoleophilia bacterium]